MQSAAKGPITNQGGGVARALRESVERVALLEGGVRQLPERGQLGVGPPRHHAQELLLLLPL